MNLKKQGMDAVSRLLQIRQKFPKASLNVKKQYAEQFKQALLQLVAYLKVQKNSDIANSLKDKLPQLEKQLREYKKQVELEGYNEKKNSKPTDSKTNNSKPNNSKPQNQMQSNIADAIVREKPNVQWDDVAGLVQAKTVLQQAVILPTKFPQVFIGQRTPWKGILLYGPPGTGKTFLAKACATQMKGSTFFSISSSDLMSKYVGQSEKTLKTLFEVARKQKPSIIFIDEIDSIAGQRSQNENEVSRRVKTQLLVQMQGVGNNCKDVLILGATNLPWAIDSAVRRRFQKRVYIPLPDVKGRIALLSRSITHNNIEITQQQMRELVRMTQGYSGSDLANVVKDALMNPIRSLDQVNCWVKIEGTKQCSPVYNNQSKDPTKQYLNGNMYDVKKQGYDLHLTITYRDFQKALKSTKPSVSSDDLERYIEFTKSFGMDG